MAVQFDRETIDRLRDLPTRKALTEAKSAAYRLGSVGSEDFLTMYQQLVDEGIVSWDQVEEFEAPLDG
ncbi:MAG: hypothetical protein GY716_16300 [bacterium]|nr:hypothetical protein [bacterium]